MAKHISEAVDHWLSTVRPNPGGNREPETGPEGGPASAPDAETPPLPRREVREADARWREHQRGCVDCRHALSSMRSADLCSGGRKLWRRLLWVANHVHVGAPKSALSV